MKDNNQQASYFEALSASRAESAKALESFALRGVKGSVVEKYSDQAHFIYELLQNADDAEATSVRFELFKDKLIFAHDGTIRFFVSNPETEEEDQANNQLGSINAITAVAASNKTDSSTIGKFGVGFKAVFQYTKTPYIYDPDIFFKIERFIVPIRLKADYPGRISGETLFVFPFDHDMRSQEDAYSDISEKLRSLDYPLLFLSRVRDISYKISDVEGYYGKEPVEESFDIQGTSAEFIRLSQNEDKKYTDLYEDLWLFSRKDKEGHTYSVGYFVDKEGKLTPKKHNAFCFFPTKEATNLNFIIHAPFLLTDSREGIRAGEQHNLYMILLLSKLAADSLVYLRDIGQSKNTPYINDDIFKIVPYDENLFGDENSGNAISFKPFYTAIKEMLSHEEILPALSGYANAEDAYWASVPDIAELFSDQQLAMLTENDAAKWVFRSFGRNETERQNKTLSDYIDELFINCLDDSDILRDSYYGMGISASFIEAQSVKWLHRFYKWIARSSGRKNLVLDKPIFWDQNRKAAAAFDNKKQALLFLPTEEGSEYPTIYDALLENEDTAEFIKKVIGICEPSLKDEIKHKILPQYQPGVPINTRPHFRKFFRYYQTCSQAERKGFLEQIKDCQFILYQSADSTTQYRERADELYFRTDPLLKWFETKPDTKFVSYNEYVDLVGEDKEEDLREFLFQLGVKDVPRVLTRQLNWQDAQKLRTCIHKRLSRVWKWEITTIDSAEETEIS